MSSTPWLSPDEQRAWRMHLAATRALLSEVDAQLQRDAGLSHADYEILVRLSEATGRTARMSQLALALRFSRSRLSHAVARLERSGLVLRSAYQGDGRGTVAVLTDAGFAALEAAAPGHVRAVRAHLVDALSAEQLRQLYDIGAAVCSTVPGSAPHGEGERGERDGVGA